tara:strand:+ start:28193 stop:29575 length:1383 start_codon:yes stop_codon:yes gene_type:complete
MQTQGYVLSSKKLPSLDARLVQINALEHLPEEGCSFVVFDFDDNITFETLATLRQTKTYRYCPFFSWDGAPDKCKALLDGGFDEAAYSKAEAINERITICQQNDGAHPEKQDMNVFICRYMFSRENLDILPRITYENIYGFVYPIVQALASEGSANEHWYVLNALVKRGYFEAREVVNELQICPGCEGGLLNFKHCCPNCESVDLHIEPFVHCFTCGNVGPVKEFMKHQELVCGRCQTTLKHIGIDYDKPLEDKICEKCQHRFFDPSTRFMCLACEKIGDPESLNTRKLCAFHLTKKGEEFSKNNLQKLELDLGAFFELINFDLLELIIQWQVGVAQRHKEVEFVAGVMFVENIDALIEDIGFLKTEQQLVLFYENARDLFRQTDLLSVDDDKLFCLLTMTNSQYIPIIQERIRDFDKDHADKGGKLSIKFGFVSSSEILEGKLDKELLINEMLNRVSDD